MAEGVPLNEKELRTTAYHEAGHVVAAYWEHIRVRLATIVPTDDTAGHVKISSPLREHHEVEAAAGPRNRSRMERIVRVKFAGFAAQRRFNKRSARYWHAGNDYHEAADLASYFTGNSRELEAYLNLLLVQAEGLHDRPFVWDQVTAVADALLAKKTLKPAELREGSCAAHLGRRWIAG